MQFIGPWEGPQYIVMWRSLGEGNWIFVSLFDNEREATRYIDREILSIDDAVILFFSSSLPWHHTTVWEGRGGLK